MAATAGQNSSSTAATIGPSRSLYFGNLSPLATYYDVCKLANQYGGLELVKIVPQKKCAFVNFINQEDAERLYTDSQEGTIELCDQKVIIGWAKSSVIKAEILTAIAEGATRNLFVAGIGGASEHVLSSVFLRFGDIENIVCMPKKGFGFVNMTSVKTALEAKHVCETTGVDIGGRRLTVKFAKEGVNARDPRTVARQPAPFQQPQQGYPPRHQMQQQPPQRFMNGGGHPGQMQHRDMGHMAAPSRAIYLGNLPDEVENRDLCKLGNKFGVLELVRINKDKKNGFINFIDPVAAEALFLAAQQRPFLMYNTQVRVGWAKSAPLRPELQEAVSQGATRNLYIGGVSENITEANLKELIAPYCHGEFDGIHILRPKKIAFVNLISIKAAIQARQALQSADPPIVLDGLPIKINFAKETIGGGGGRSIQQHPSQRPPRDQHFHQAQHHQMKDHSHQHNFHGGAPSGGFDQHAPPAGGMFDQQQQQQQQFGGDGSFGGDGHLDYEQQGNGSSQWQGF